METDSLSLGVAGEPGLHPIGARMPDEYQRDEKTFGRLFRLYEEELCLLQNDACRRCDAVVKQPLAMWHVGADYFNSDRRVLFVGKPHRGCLDGARPSGVVDPWAVTDELRSSSWAYWRYTSDIANELHGDEGWSRIALTNVVKCTNVTGENGSLDRTSSTMVEQCVGQLDVITAEIRILQPTHIVMYTASFFPDSLKNVSLGAAGAWATDTDGKRACGKKMLRWQERSASAEWGGQLKLLVTGHPERMRRTEYTSMIARWLRS